MRTLLYRALARRVPIANRVAFNSCQLRSVSDVTLQSIYSGKVAEGSLDFDENQFKLIKILNKISTHLVNQERTLSAPITIVKEDSVVIPITEQSVGDSIPIGNTAIDSTHENAQNISDTAIIRARGLYIYGDVGIGKTVVMDMFFDNCDIPNKKRVHFHQFMLDIHHRIHIYKKHLLQTYGRDIQLNMASERDAITQVAEQISKECKLLCFDEFQVTDICDAMILSKLFNVLWMNGTLLVATSNRPPSDLYKDGLNRAYFTPFITQLERECLVKQISSTKDYRQENKPLPNSYYNPVTAESKSLLFNDFLTHSYQYRQLSEELYVPGEIIENDISVMMGRTVKVKTVNASSKTCFVEFSYLCETDRGASDYHAICKNYDTIYLHGIPILSILEHDRARRFITLIDEIYDAGAHLVWTAEMEPNYIFKELTPVEIIIEKKEGRKFGTDHSWGTDPNMIQIPAPQNTGNNIASAVFSDVNNGSGSGSATGSKVGTNAWLDQSVKTDIYPAVSRTYI